ncbi:MAG: VWA domain-containing protein, partial [Gallionellaceae bacterium]|nr:VWA domain-containing protein [Gallionellaceae bacterium]
MKSSIKRLAHAIRGRISPVNKPAPPVVEAVDERPKTTFPEVQRRIGIYLRALWGCDFMVRQIFRKEGESNAERPYVANGAIYLPAVLYGDGAADIYRAAAAHAAAHLIYSTKPIADKTLTPWQKAVIGAVEDARVEALSGQNFPGLKQAWIAQHTATPAQNHSASDYLDRLARALLDEHYRDGDAWITAARAAFAGGDKEVEHFSRDIGLALADAFSDKGIAFNPRNDALRVAYRDDNRFIWQSAHLDDGKRDGTPSVPFTIQGAILKSSDLASTGEDAKKGAKLTTRKLKARKVVGEPWGYSEWDFRSQTDTPNWVTLREFSTPPGDPGLIDSLVSRNIHLAQRMKALLNAIRFGSPSRIRKLEEGDEIDINAAIRAQIDIRLHIQHDPRIMMRSMRKDRDIAVLVLLDLSRSMNLKLEGQEQSALDLTREVCALFADAMDAIGDAFAIHGFCSESRHYVEYFRLKDFGQPYDDVPKAQLAGMVGDKSTRIGAAIRHATYYL